MTPGISQAKFVLPPLPELRSVSVFGRRICYYDVGSGPVLVLVHGLGGDADEWAWCIGPLSTTHRVIALEMLGFGRSDKPPITYRIAGFVEVLERFLQALGIERASLLGHSLGGWIVASFALQFQDRVDKLVLADAAGIDAGGVKPPIDLNVSTRTNMREVLEFVFHNKAMVSDDLVDLSYKLHLERGDGPTIRSVLETILAPDEKLDNRLGALHAPTLLLWGKEDALTPLAIAENFLRLIPGSQLAVIPECGHIPCLEKPVEFVQAVSNFLRQ
jgi:pimeloyl-ACP methyl ester carboxylesterase